MPGAQLAPAASCAKCRKHTSVVTTGTPQQSDIPCAMVLTAYSALSSATNSSCHRRPRIKADQPGRVDFASVDLAPATGVRTTRFCRTQPVYAKGFDGFGTRPPKL